MTDLELRLAKTLDSAAEQTPVPADAWARNRQLLLATAPPQRRLSSGIAVFATAAACVVIVLVTFVVVRTTRNSGTPPAGRNPAPKATLSLEQRFSSQYLKRCLRIGEASKMTPDQEPSAVVRLVHQYPDGEVAAITTDRGLMWCGFVNGKLSGYAQTYGVYGTPAEIYAPVVTESDSHEGARPGTIGWEIEVGRVAKNVAGVQFAGTSVPVTWAAIGDGVFIARWRITPGLNPPVAGRSLIPGPVAYDASGRVVYSQRYLSTPDGHETLVGPHPDYPHHIPWP